MEFLSPGSRESWQERRRRPPAFEAANNPGWGELWRMNDYERADVIAEIERLLEEYTRAVSAAERNER